MCCWSKKYQKLRIYRIRYFLFRKYREKSWHFTLPQTSIVLDEHLLLPGIQTLVLPGLSRKVLSIQPPQWCYIQGLWPSVIISGLDAFVPVCSDLSVLYIHLSVYQPMREACCFDTVQCVLMQWRNSNMLLLHHYTRILLLGRITIICSIYVQMYFLTPFSKNQYTVCNSKKFSDSIWSIGNANEVFMTSFDVESLYKNIPLNETNDIHLLIFL